MRDVRSSSSTARGFLRLFEARQLRRALGIGACVLSSAVAATVPSTEAAAAEPVPTAAPRRPCTPGSAETKQEAITRYERGIQLFEEQDYRLALVEFERAYELTCTPSVLYNIGVIHFTLNNYSAALRAFEEYLARQPNVEPARREQVERDVKALKGRVAVISVTVNVPGASISLDDQTFSDKAATNQLVDAGRHQLTVSKSGYVTHVEPVVLAVGDRKTIDVKLMPLAQPKRESPSYVWIGWVTTGALAAAAGVTGVLSIVSANRADRLENEAFAANSTELRDEARTAQNFALATDILAGAAVLAGGVSLYFTLKGPSKKDEGVAISPFGASFRARF